MADSLSTIMWVAVLLIMMLYISGIFFHQQIGDAGAGYAGMDEKRLDGVVGREYTPDPSAQRVA